MARERKKPRFSRLKCPSEKVFKDKKKGKRIKRPTAEELSNIEDTHNV